ncbi:hypothetical protein [Microvirga vignae]|nr:hypothetical protein [Microvirga vignae]
MTRHLVTGAGMMIHHAIPIADIGVAAMVRHLGLVHGGVAIMSAHTGSGASTTTVTGEEDTDHAKKVRGEIS